MKKFSILYLTFILLGLSCRKTEDTKSSSQNNNTAQPDNYVSLTSFFNANKSNTTTVYTASSATANVMVTAQGTKIEIPPMAFVNSSGQPINGTYTVTFTDIYKKSDMFFAQMPTSLMNGEPLKSGGEFRICVTSGNELVSLAPGKKITVTLPATLSGGIDAMNPQTAFVWKDTIVGQFKFPIWGVPDTTTIDSSQFIIPSDTVETLTQQYVYSMYKFGSTSGDSGTWCNSDNSRYFLKYPQTKLTILEDDSSSIYGTQVFLVFKKVNCMVHLYNYVMSIFQYDYAPTGLECTVVAIGLKGGSVYSSFTPITITTNQTVHFSMTKTTTEEFKSKLKALD